MFIIKTPVAVVAGMALAGAILMAPGVVAAPTIGRAAAWGYNVDGQLGDNTTTNSSVPVAVNTAGVLAGKTVSAITAGLSHSCVVADGQAYCWGDNTFGQLGDNSTTDSKVPVAVNTAGALAGKTLSAISAGRHHTCTVADGQAYCWGYNGGGELGNNSTTDSKVPVAVNTAGALSGKTVSTIYAGDFHTCVVADGQAYCWGYNNYGELGDNTTTNSKVPVAVNTAGALAGKAVTEITAGYFHTCVVASGQAYCWGANSSGQLGDNTTTDSKVPVAVNTAGPLAGRMVTAITAGYFHTCVVAERRASCWGDNTYGELGDNSITNSKVPVAASTAGVLASRTVTEITAGAYHTCAAADGRAFCWGANGVGQLGNNATANSYVPIAVDTTALLNGQTVTAITAGGYHSAVLAAAPPQPPTAVNGAPGNAQVTVAWSAPADDGGSPVIDYTVTTIPGGATCTTSSTSCVVPGLTNGTAYTFTVIARNAIGTSTPSTPSAPVTPTAPVAPITPAKQKQTASVKVPKKIMYKGKTVLLKKAVRTNAGQKAKSKITVKPKKKKYAKVKTTKKGKVTIKTLGKKKLKVTLKLTAPATSQYTAYSYTKKWTVTKKKRS
ncbi:MAG: fibronectin type III domain-containing protein [Candidatus Nanopelagicales bacterium]